jgi:hypothetical protein
MPQQGRHRHQVGPAVERLSDEGMAQDVGWG